MEYSYLGSSGLQVSRLAFGSWATFHYQVDQGEATALMQACRDNGVNFFDNSESYADGRAELLMGQAIRDLGWRRSEVVISTKIFWGARSDAAVNETGLSRKHILEGLRGSLQRLGLDYVDIVLCQRPDIYTPIEETVRALNWVINKGLAMYWGTSEWSSAQIAEACKLAKRLDLVGPVVEQPQYNLFERHKVESELMPLYSKHGIGLATWSPLASGLLTGKYSNGNIPPDCRFAMDKFKLLAENSLVDEKLAQVDGLKPIASELGVSLAQLAIAWCVSNPHVTSVITGASKKSQIAENMKALEILPQLTPQVLKKIEEVVRSKPKRTKNKK